MTTYYVDNLYGNNANNGLGPDASHASNKPWKTIAKALGAAGIASGDIVYLSPSTWFREIVTVAMTSATVETKVLGDPWNSQGFKSDVGVRIAPGPVVWTAFLTDEKTAPSTSTLLNLAGRDFLTFQNLMMFGGNNGTSSIVIATTQTSTNINFTDCAFIPFFNRPIIDATAAFGVAMNWAIDRCYFGPNNATLALRFTGVRGTGTDWDMNVRIRNCVFCACGTTSIQLSSSGAGANLPGGLVVNANSFLDSRAVQTNTSTSSLVPSYANDNTIVSMGNVGLTAGAANSLSEDFNVIWATSETSGTIIHGGNSKSGDDYALVLNMMGQDRIWLPGARRPFMEALAPDPQSLLWLGLVGGSGFTTGVDMEGYMRSETPMPGAFGKRHNDFVRDTATPFTDDGSNLVHFGGFGDFNFVIPVEVGFTYTIEIDMQYEAGYDDTPFGKPQAELVSNPRIGFSGETKTMTVAAATPETLSFTPFAPVNFAHDFVYLRILDVDGGGAGTVRCGNLTITRV